MGANLDLYLPYVDDTEASAILQWERYIFHKDYDQPIVDIFPHILANAFKVDVIILNELINGICEFREVTSRSYSSGKTLFLHRVNDNHYNGTGPCVFTASPDEDSRIPYSRDELLALNNQNNIARSVRKQLFKHKLWRPRNVESILPPDKSISPSVDSILPPDELDKQRGPRRPEISTLKCGTLNPWSACNKALHIRDLIIEENLDLLAITETYQITPSIQAKLLPPNYGIAYNPRESKSKSKGGGCALIYRKESITCGIVKKYNSDNCEGFHAKLTLPHTCVNVVVIYAPKPKASDSTASNEFISEFSTILTDELCDLKNLLILGDFNYHYQKKNDNSTRDFVDLITNCNLIQHINVPTHRKGNTLDLVFSRADELKPFRIKTNHDVSSDHYAVIFNINVSKPVSKSKNICRRSWKSLDIDSFKTDINQSELPSIPSSHDISEAISLYDNVLTELSDKHAPLKEIKPRSHDTPWFNEDIRGAKRTRRQAERLWRKHDSESLREVYRAECNTVNALLDAAHREYYHDKLSNITSQKDTYRIASGLLFGDKVSALPTADSIPDLAEKFSTYFSEKIRLIREDLDSQNSINSDDRYKPDIKHILNEFSPATEIEISKIIKACASKSCELDPIPTWLLKLCLDELLPAITHIVNLSLSTSEVPPKLKFALLVPLIKKLLLDPELLKNFRPVSNLSFISKLIERVVCSRLNDHLARNKLSEIFQSAYKEYHSTETALLRVQNDLLIALDKDGGVILMLLDLSAAFDTIDHNILFRRLYNLGVRGPALAWFRSYLKGRTQSVIIGDTKSGSRDLPYGVPQGSVLGPILFTIYTLPLGDIARTYGLRVHIYADDTQLYISFSPLDPNSLQSKIGDIQACFQEIKKWMTANLLKLNGDKTELLIALHKRFKDAVTVEHVDIDAVLIKPSDSIRNLGAYFNRTMDHQDFVNKKCQAARFALRNISKVRTSLTRESCETLIQAYVTSRLDYCNVLLHGLPKYVTDRIQKVQNSAARVIVMIPKREHITPYLAALHWLPIQQRVEYKVLLYAFKALNNHAPEYLCELLNPYTPARSMRDRETRLIPPVKKSNYVDYGGRAFERSAPELWNTLPGDVRSVHSRSDLSSSERILLFKRKLKTYLFAKAYF